ncbi:hypothetical protein [Curtobacterium sp. TC1]|uniref:hypothetical protein n=1 Tax=Curtobacterium sp. TC1 TaxID=2862880 RepID=UPI0028FCA0AB|nr:hypothetical protein [Curtobacterium sp. TC1]
MSEPSPARPVRSEASVGVVQAIIAYGLWGLMPLLFAAMAPAGAFEIVAWRIVFGLVFSARLRSPSPARGSAPAP